MKINKIFLGLGVAMTALFTACDVDNEGTIYNAQGQGLSMPASALGSVEVPSSNPIFNVAIQRGTNKGTFTGSMKTLEAKVDDEAITDYDNYFKVGDFTFAEGSYATEFPVNVEKLDVGKSLYLKLAYTDTLNLSPSYHSGMNVVTVTISKAYAWTDLGTGHYYSPDWWEEDFDVAIQKAEGFNIYKIISLFQEGYDIQFEITPANVVIVPKQASWVHSSYGTVSLEGYADENFVAGNYDPATKTATLTLRHTVSAGSFGAYTDTLVMP